MARFAIVLTIALSLAACSAPDEEPDLRNGEVATPVAVPSDEDDGRVPAEGAAAVADAAGVVTDALNAAADAPPQTLRVCPDQRGDVCPSNYDPVCGVREDGTVSEFSNHCQACLSSDVVGSRAGPCPASPVKSVETPDSLD